ncbi:hypothetical protein RO3G_06363 [Rhizopus delemar RA 99-880]|uniref:Co-chaperone HscB C-terminal oligomerisation domain-containing protein n=3 Tax=Rhizopus TaxID=4842 RepID=I1BZM8_RHIO9|nr:hypothetical protein RO3G_06363 [Rhizopus delemar RA 99-880]|eukprot:EIE81658.1 hypothetical protein RO3G_06363 [Rhizopus delemar RA 99-880]
MEVMELREELEEVANEGELQVVKEKNDEKFKETIERLQTAFDKEDYVQAKELAIELQYWSSIQNAIHEWQP